MYHLSLYPVVIPFAVLPVMSCAGAPWNEVAAWRPNLSDLLPLWSDAMAKMLHRSEYYSANAFG